MTASRRKFVLLGFASALVAGTVAVALAHRIAMAGSLPYHDQFAAGRMDEWTAYGGVWQLGGGMITNASDDVGAKLVTGSSHLRNYRVQSDVKLTNGFGDAGLIVRVTDAEEGTNAFNGYYAGIRLPDQLLLGKMDFGYRPLSQARIPIGVKPGLWYRLAVEANGCTITARATSLNGDLLATASMTETRQCDQNGAFGLRSFAAGGSWRNVVVEATP